MEITRIRLQNALSDENVKELFHIDLMNFFKELGIDYPKECKSLTDHILFELKNTTNLGNFEETIHSMFQNYKVLGKDLLKVIFEKNDLYKKALFSEIKESMKSDLEESLLKNIPDFIDEGCIHYSENSDFAFVVNILSHFADLNGSLENITKRTNKRIVIIETIPFDTKIKEHEINKRVALSETIPLDTKIKQDEINRSRTLLNDYFYHCIFCYKKDKPFFGDYKIRHAWDLLFHQKGFEVKPFLSKIFDFDNSPVPVKTRHYIGVYEKTSDAIDADCK